MPKRVSCIFYAPGFSSLRSLRSLHDITKDAFGVPKGWIAFTNGIFDSWEPPIWVTVAARPQVSVLVAPPPRWSANKVWSNKEIQSAKSPYLGGNQDDEIVCPLI